MITKIWYSVQNGGDGSAYPVWMESEALARWDQDNMDEGWGEDCSGWITVESDGPIKVKDTIETVAGMLAELEEELGESWHSEANRTEICSKIHSLKELET